MDRAILHRSPLVLIAAAVLLPPVGLVLLWGRGGTRLRRKILGSLAIAALAVGHLVLFFGLTFEMDGTGMWPVFKFYKPELHYAAIEESRAEQRAAMPPPESGVAAAAAVPQPAEAPSAAGPGETAPAAADAMPEPAGDRPVVPAAYWTDFRGPNRDGRYDQTPIRTDWPSGGLPLLWRQPVGLGYASFVVAGGQVFTIEQRRRQEVVAAYDVGTGRENWTHAYPAEFVEAMGGDGPRATPTWHDGRLYSLGATGELRCLDAKSGRQIWGKNILAENGAENLKWGMAAAPLVVDDKLIVLPGGPGGRSVVAYHKLTGEPIWKVLDDKQAYTSPVLVTLAGQRQILVVSALRIMGLRVEDGGLLWDYPWTTSFDINSAQPLIVSDNRLFISAGYGHGAALIELRRAGEKLETRTVWQNTSMKNKFNSSVLYQGHVYGLDESILACVDVETGERKWKGGRYGYGQLLLADGRLVILTEFGDVVLVKATPAGHQEVARFSAIEGKTWNHPAIDGGLLFVRNTTEMASFRIAP